MAKLRVRGRLQVLILVIIAGLFPIAARGQVDETLSAQIDVKNDGINSVYISYYGRVVDFDHLNFLAPTHSFLYVPDSFDLTENPPESLRIEVGLACPAQGVSAATFTGTKVTLELAQLESKRQAFYVERQALMEQRCDPFPAHLTNGVENFAYEVRATIVATFQSGTWLEGSDSPYFGQTAITINNSDLYYTADAGEACDATFADVLDPRPVCFGEEGNPFFADIEWLAETGTTRGCNPPDNTLFCPYEFVTRGQMAAFLVRALELGSSSQDVFSDDDGSVFEREIQALAASGVTRGCNPPDNTLFCPNEFVTRSQMAAFLHRALAP